MEEEKRAKYLEAVVISDKDKEKLKKIAENIGGKVEDILKDIFTLSITTKYRNEKSVVAKTDLHFDGDIDVVLPTTEQSINQQTLDFHQKMVDLAMKNRRELIRILLELFDLKDLLKFF
jgi:hypothetical protein